jgi:hypothetical protein
VGIVNAPYSFTGGMSGGGYGKLDLKLSYACATTDVLIQSLRPHHSTQLSIEFLAYSPLMTDTIGLLPRPLTTQDGPAKTFVSPGAK